MERLKRRAEFLRAARGRRFAMPGLVLQAIRRPRNEGKNAAEAGPDPDAVRVGFTCSKKVGNAVARNRARRRLREAVRIVLPAYGLPGHDYVVIGRAGTLSRPFATLVSDLERAVAKVNGELQRRPRGPRDTSGKTPPPDPSRS